MAGKVFTLADVGNITVIKRASSRNIRLSIRNDGQIMVSIPHWSTYASGMAFAHSKADWLKTHARPAAILVDGQAVGKFHHLLLKPTQGLSAPRALVSKTAVTVRFPIGLDPASNEVQSVAAAACIRALRAQATQLLPGRLRELADQHGFDYTDVAIKRLKGRWGSCDSQQHIVLNLFLMQLPWNCIDYVLLHELTHTVIMRHGPPFWDKMTELIPHIKLVRTQMRQFQPVLLSGSQTVQ